MLCAPALIHTQTHTRALTHTRRGRRNGGVEAKRAAVREPHRRAECTQGASSTSHNRQTHTHTRTQTDAHGVCRRALRTPSVCLRTRSRRHAHSDMCGTATQVAMRMCIPVQGEERRCRRENERRARPSSVRISPPPVGSLVSVRDADTWLPLGVCVCVCINARPPLLLRNDASHTRASPPLVHTSTRTHRLADLSHFFAAACGRVHAYSSTSFACRVSWSSLNGRDGGRSARAVLERAEFRGYGKGRLQGGRRGKTNTREGDRGAATWPSRRAVREFGGGDGSRA